MSVVTRAEQVSVEGGVMSAHLAVPTSGRGPGLLLLQEVFGVNDYITGRAATLAGMGYTVLAPDLYWRLEPELALPHDAEGLQRAFGYHQRLDEPRAIQDAAAAFRHLRRLAECDGRAGVIGFCLGGRIGYHVTALEDPDAAVLYYGSGIADRLELAPSLRCPTLMHFGADDPYIPPEAVERIRAAFQGREEVEIAVQPDAEHAFDNYLAPMFHRPAAALAAWQLTEEFLARRLPVEPQAAGK